MTEYIETHSLYEVFNFVRLRVLLAHHLNWWGSRVGQRD